MSDLDSVSNDAGFTAEEQAAFDAYASGADASAPASQEPAGGPEPSAAASVAPNAASPAAAPAGEPAAAPGEVVDPDADDVDDAEANRGRFVRHGAFHKERERRKAVERELTEYRERFARGDERLRLLTEAMQKSGAAAAPAAAAPAEPETPPDPNEDIFGYAKWLEKQLNEVRTGQQQVTEAQTRAAEEQRAASERNAIIGYYQQDIQQATAADPSVRDAYAYLFQGRVSEMMHFGMTQSQAVEAVQAEEFDLVRGAIERRQSPAAMIVHLAKGRGFAAKAAEPAATAAPTAETPADKAARVAAGQAASKSLSAAGGGPAGEVTLDQLASMSEADFEKFAAKNPRKLAALMGAA